MLASLTLLFAAIKAKNYGEALRQLAVFAAAAAELYDQLVGVDTAATVLDAKDMNEIDEVATELAALRDGQSFATDGAKALDPGSWIAIINMVLAIIEIIRKRRAEG